MHYSSRSIAGDRKKRTSVRVGAARASRMTSRTRRASCTGKRSSRWYPIVVPDANVFPALLALCLQLPALHSLPLRDVLG